MCNEVVLFLIYSIFSTMTGPEHNKQNSLPLVRQRDSSTPGNNCFSKLASYLSAFYTLARYFHFNSI